MESTFDPIRCFQHQENEPNISCFAIPAYCPVCKQSLKHAAFFIPPFRLPSPFCYNSNDGKQRQRENYPCKVLIKPTNGSFLSDYSSGDNLHIGLTDSRGLIYSFDEDGITVENTGWNNCLSIAIIDTTNARIIASWDDKLGECVHNLSWLPKCYKENSNNCFTFVLHFLKTFLQDDLTKEAFSEKYILPLTRRAADYIAIYRKIKSNGFYIHQ